MENNLHWKLNIWPESLRGKAVRFSEEDTSFSAFPSRLLQCHHSFALGFFGFHYIRASKDDDLALKCESLQIFQKLIISCDLDRISIKGMKDHNNERFSDFWNNVIRRVALALGDAFGQEAQQMAELGFWLAAVYAGLVQGFRDNDDSYMKECLLVLEDNFMSSQYSNVPMSIQNSLGDIKKLLQYKRKRPTFHKCLNKIESVLKQGLILNTAI